MLEQWLQAFDRRRSRQNPVGSGQVLDR